MDANQRISAGFLPLSTTYDEAAEARRIHRACQSERTVLRKRLAKRLRRLRTRLLSSSEQRLKQKASMLDSQKFEELLEVITTSFRDLHGDCLRFSAHLASQFIKERTQELQSYVAAQLEKKLLRLYSDILEIRVHPDHFEEVKGRCGQSIEVIADSAIENGSAVIRTPDGQLSFCWSDHLKALTDEKVQRNEVS